MQEHTCGVTNITVYHIIIFSDKTTVVALSLHVGGTSAQSYHDHALILSIQVSQQRVRSCAEHCSSNALHSPQQEAEHYECYWSGHHRQKPACVSVCTCVSHKRGSMNHTSLACACGPPLSASVLGYVCTLDLAEYPGPVLKPCLKAQSQKSCCLANNMPERYVPNLMYTLQLGMDMQTSCSMQSRLCGLLTG